MFYKTVIGFSGSNYMEKMWSQSM